MSTETTRMTLVRSMLRLVREKRFSSITIEDICDRSKVSRRTFYRYYPDKHALLRDVYLECFFSKIQIEDGDDFWDIFSKVCEQIYSDKRFFGHALEVKGQNGFWDEASAILTPYYIREAPSYEFVDQIKEFFVVTDINRLFNLIENWINSGMKESAKEFAKSIRVSYYIYGIWTSQLASRRERSSFSPDIYSDFEEYLEKHQ